VEPPAEVLPDEGAAADWLPPEAFAAMVDLQRQIEEISAEALAEIRRRLPPQATERLDAAIEWAQEAEAGVLALQVLGLLLAMALVVRVARGRGDVAVAIEYPAELRGTFSVRITTRRPRSHNRGRILSPAAAQRAKSKASASSRTEHHMVSRETQFRDVRSGRYFITADGFLQAPDQENVLATRCTTREVKVRRGRTVRAAFDFHPTTCTIVAKIQWNKGPAQDARVAVRGVAGSLRFARNGSARIGVQLGRHTLMVGSGDRVAEVELDVASFKPTSVQIDLSNRDKLLFNGCPPAVEPYLNGDVAEAARALEREGQVEVSQLLLARQALLNENRESAARYFERAGRLVEAAELHESLREFAPAASLFERAGEYERAADMLRQSGDLLRAGQMFERANQLELAVESYRKAGDRSSLVDALEKAGQAFEAAQISIGVGDWPRAIRSLQQVDTQDEHFLEAADLLTGAYQREGHIDLAIRTLEKVVTFRGEDDVPLEDCDRLAKLLEEAREYERAIEVLEVIRRRDVTFAGIAPRIENLRKRSTASQLPAPGATNDAEGFGGVRYDILAEVGRGGMGVVFKARDRRLGRTVALKRLTEALREHPKAVELFLREARAAAALNHPNIVTLYDAGQEGDTFYITMEFLEGSPFQAILARKEKLSARDVARLGIQVADGLAYAEEQQIVHRDIKTANLFFTHKKVVKIMDFGLAKMIEEVRKSSTVIGGTPYYMAPEQSLGHAVDHRADLYALGVTFFELVTGSVPFREGDVAYHHRHSPPPDPRERAPEVPEAMAELILHMMAKDPDARCSSGREVSRRLQEILRASK
jgi:tRNA A-37 threonylcarbamoyl transferase component Bud32